MVLNYSYIDTVHPVPVPERSVNGGLYVGAPFKDGAQWANVPVVPEPDTYTQNLASANPPPGGMFIPSNTRPGNNYVKQVMHQPYGEQYNFMCRKTN